MNNRTATWIEVSDEELWRMASQGSREAFERIVARYQTLVCSLAYSASGNIAASEDLAQETFIAAWQRLRELREPSKLRGWLCGIVRNLAANAFRKEQRRGGPPESLDLASDQVLDQPDPAAQAVTREEEKLVWNSLETLPENYREPLVLFYRQSQSVAEVALALEISEEAVKQRLSRGRALLREEVSSVIESALSRSRPSPAFTSGVLAALPFVAASQASAAAFAGATGKGLAGTAKGVAGTLGPAAILGPIVGLAIGWFSSKAAASTARSPEEKTCILRYARRMVLFCFVMSLGLAAVLSQAGKLYSASPFWILVGVSAWVAALLGVILWTSGRVDRKILRIRLETGTEDAEYAAKLASVGLASFGPLRYESKARILGLPLFSFALGSLDSGPSRSYRAVGWIALGDVAISPLFAFGGLACAPIAMGGLTVGVLSLSLWGAALGVLSFGSIAVGWCAYGIAAAGWKAAFGGGVALAGEYAVGGWLQAGKANSAIAKQWFSEQWFSAVMAVFAANAHWLILLAGVLSLGVIGRRAWLLRRL